MHARNILILQANKNNTQVARLLLSEGKAAEQRMQAGTYSLKGGKDEKNKTELV